MQVWYSRMSHGASILAAVVLAASLAGCQACGGGARKATPAAAASPPVTEATPGVMNADIQVAIEKHIADTAARHGGYFPLEYEGQVLQLKLVRVHTEYLANLGPREHFACVDLASSEGDVYDVDFDLYGDPGAMTVTETYVHKRNGVPFYLWEQLEDKTWVRRPVAGAPEPLLGVIRGRDAFEFRYDATLPTLDGNARLWLPLAKSDRFQTVAVREISAPGRHETLTDNHGNRVLLLHLRPEDSGRSITLRFQVERREAAPYAEPDSDPAESLNPETLVPAAPAFRALAGQVTAGRTGALARARAIFDHTLETFRYQRYGEGWGRGDALRECDARSGNCTDFHAYFIALARAAGIPARFTMGAAIPSERGDGGIDGYHCWAEFYAEGKWWPVDLSEADKYAPLATYYFGHQPANRVELSRGRDLQLQPGPAAGPINFLAYPVLEVEGMPASITARFSFRRTTSAVSSRTAAVGGDAACVGTYQDDPCDPRHSPDIMLTGRRAQ